jgi:predicted nucleic acid-binding protein
VNLLVDTSVWSLALRREPAGSAREVARLRRAIEEGEAIFTTGLVLQELLQGFSGPKARAVILERFSTLPLLVPDRQDHTAAAEVRNICRRAGVQIGTIDALLIQLCQRYELTLLSTDRDFHSASAHVIFPLWA